MAYTTDLWRAILSRLLPDFNQALNVLVPKGTSKGGTVQYLDTFPSTAVGTAECAAACIKHAERCWSFVHMAGAADSELAGQCFAVTSPGFNPSYDPTAVSGTVDWGCRSDDDCSLNGKCGAGQCACRPAWKGDHCETLKWPAEAATM